MKKNVAGQVIGAQMIDSTNGADFTGTVTVYVTGDAGTQTIGSVGSGVCTHEGRGLHTYLPAQAETNFDHVAFTFAGTNAITATVQVYPTFPQTGDNFARIGATGSGLTSLATPTNITAGTITTVTNLTNAPTAGDLTATMKASVNAEVVDTLNVDTYAEPGQEAPPATTTLVKKIGWLYKAFRNRKTQTATTLSIFADDATTVDAKSTISDDGTTYSHGEVATGP